MFDFDDDSDFDLMDIVEADIQYGLFEEDAKILYQKKEKDRKKKSFFDWFKL